MSQGSGQGERMVTTRIKLFLVISLLLAVCSPTVVYLSEDTRSHDHHMAIGRYDHPIPPNIWKETPFLVAHINKKEPVIITRGGLLGSQNVEKFTGLTRDSIRQQYLYPEGSVIGFGCGADGYVHVTLWNGPPPPNTTTTPDEIYATLDAWGKEMGMEEVPVRFVIRTSPPILTLHRR